jgi:hypothetical protein
MTTATEKSYSVYTNGLAYLNRFETTNHDGKSVVKCQVALIMGTKEKREYQNVTLYVRADQPKQLILNELSNLIDSDNKICLDLTAANIKAKAYTGKDGKVRCHLTGNLIEIRQVWVNGESTFKQESAA